MENGLAYYTKIINTQVKSFIEQAKVFFQKISYPPTPPHFFLCPNWLQNI
jgi:hypothetical protein